jgi:hypothetical protein
MTLADHPTRSANAKTVVVIFVFRFECRIASSFALVSRQATIRSWPAVVVGPWGGVGLATNCLTTMYSGLHRVFGSTPCVRVYTVIGDGDTA